MKRLITIFAFLFLLTFVGTTLYVFDIPPFDQKTVNQFINKPDKKDPNELPENFQVKNISFEDHITKGDTLANNGFMDLAIKEYQTANKLDPQSIIPLLKIGKLHFKKGNYKKAQLSFEAALNTSPQNLEVTVELTRTLIAQKKIEEARNTLNQIAEENQEVKYYKGLLAILDNDQESARNLLQSAFDTNTDPVTTSNAEKFIASYREFDSFQSGADSHLKTLLARSFTQVEEFQMAIPLLFDVIREKNDYRDAWVLLGYSYLKTNKPLEAIDSLEEAKKLDPQKPETLFFLGLAYFNNDDLVGAVNNIETAIENGFEPRIEAEQKLAEIYTILQDFKEAASRYENVITLNDTNINYFVRPVWIYLDYLKDLDKAYILARKAVATHPNQAMSHNLLGWVNFEKGKHEIAKHNLNTALTLNPTFDAAYLNLGRIYEKEEKFNLAKDNYQKAHELGHGNSISELAADHYNQIADKYSGNIEEETQPTNELFQVSTLK